MIICCKCKNLKDKEDFNKNRSTDTGYSVECKLCRKLARITYYEKDKEKIKKRNQDYLNRNRNEMLLKHRKYTRQRALGGAQFIDGYKIGPCLDCFQKFPVECMDFDHKDPLNKHTNVANLKTYKKEIIWNEIQKCDLICANCHRIRTRKRISRY